MAQNIENSFTSGNGDTTEINPAKTLLSDPHVFTKFNRGPITTLFSPPATCTNVLTAMQSSDNKFFGHQFDPYFDPACYPTGALRAEQLISIPWDYYYCMLYFASFSSDYTHSLLGPDSPALCPLGWTKAATFASSAPGRDLSTFISIGPETTVAVCCPSYV